MKTSDILKKTEVFVKASLEEQQTPGHDWEHVDRVRNMAVLIAEEEGADLLVVELAALLHDIADHKFHDGDYEKGSRIARDLLEELDLDDKTVNHVCAIVSTTSYSKGAAPDSLEGECVQDADRLDALGAIGISRCFVYAGQEGLPLQDGPDSALQHFHDKVLKLKKGMHTQTAKGIAKERHEFVERFLHEFEKETRNPR